MYSYLRNLPYRDRTADLVLEPRAKHVQLRSPADLPPLVENLEARMRVLGYPGRDLFAVTLALYEAANNALRHGNRGDPGKCVHLRYLVTAAEVLIEVEDQGPGFDPDRVADPLAEANRNRPGGRGLFLMRAYMTWVSFNRQGNQVTLARQRSCP